MKYLIILYARYNDNSPDKKAMYEAETEQAAVAMFHTYLGQYMNNKAVEHVMVTVINEYGAQLKVEAVDAN